MINYKKIKEKLNNEINANKEKTSELKEKIKIINSNCFNHQIISILSLSILVLFMEMFLAMAMTMADNIVFLQVFRYFWLVIPISTGLVGNHILNKKYKVKEKLKQIFENTPSYQEKLLKITEYEIELSKLKGNNRILNKIYDDLNEEEQKVLSLDSEYYILSKDKRNKEEVEKNIVSLESSINTLEKEINLLSTKKLLQERFFEIKDKYNICRDFVMYGFVTFIFTFFLSNVPTSLILYSKSVITPSIFNILLLFLPSIISSLISFGYIYVRNKNFNEVLNKINNELGDEELLLDNDLNIDFTQEYNKKTQELFNAKKEMELEKQKVEDEDFFNKKQNEILEMDYGVPKVSNNKLDGIKNHSELYTDSPINIQLGKIYTNSEFEKRSDEVFSRELPKEDEVVLKKELHK